MHKTVIKAFVCSFSVSLLAILTANRAFYHTPQNDQEPLEISKKNIVLFLKNSGAAKFPIKKIAKEIKCADNLVEFFCHGMAAICLY